MIRAKFRCLGINLRWDGGSVVDLSPVTKRHYKYGEEPMNFAENEQFWKYSPSGECSLHFDTINLEKIPFKVGSYYYIDMEKIEDVVRVGSVLWVLQSNTNWGTNGEGEITLSRGYVTDEQGLKSGTLKIGLSGESAKVSTFGDVGKMWDVTFKLAHDHTIES